MSTHGAVVEWASTDAQAFRANRYSRAHTLAFDGGVTLPGSASPAVVPVPFCVEAAADPEEMFVASLSACHMLWFLDLARQAGLTVSRYRDAATGRMGRTPEGRTAMLEVVLRPEVDADAGPAQLADLHHKAHAACFIANSVITAVRIEPARTLQGA